MYLSVAMRTTVSCYLPFLINAKVNERFGVKKSPRLPQTQTQVMYPYSVNVYGKLWYIGTYLHSARRGLLIIAILVCRPRKAHIITNCILFKYLHNV